MYTKTEILAKLNILKAAAAAGLSFAEVTAAIGTLSGAAVSNAMERAIVAEVHLLVRTGITYVDGSHRSVGSGAPTGYDDFSVLFNAATGEEIMAITVEVFNAATYTATDPQTQQQTVRNTYLDSWTSSYTSTASTVVNKLTAVAAWCNGQGIGNSLQTLLQPKEIKSVPDREEMSQTIYIDRYAKDVIKAYELDVMLPEVVS